MVEVLAITVLCLIGLGFIGLLGMMLEFFYRVIKPKPWLDSSKDVLKVEFKSYIDWPHVNTYYRVGDTWYIEKYVDKSWVKPKLRNL